MEIIKGFKFRIYPNEEQKKLIAINIGHSRFVYNYFLKQRNEEYEKNGAYANMYELKKELTQLKKQEEFKWLNDADSHALYYAIFNLEDAYKRFYQRVKLKKNGKKIKVGFPKTKKKRSKKSYTIDSSDNRVRVLDQSHIKIGKLKKVKIVMDRSIEDYHIMSATVSISRTGKYYVSLTCSEVNVDKLPKTGKSIGLDLGLKRFITMSNGETFDLLNELVIYEKKLKREHKKLSKKKYKCYKTEDGHYRPSNNYEKQRIKLAKVYEKITNRKLALLHNLSYQLVKEYDIICIEDLAISNLLKNKKLAKAIHDSSWYEFIRMLEYKSLWYGKKLVNIDRFFPSSKLCSNCGYVLPDIDLKTREWSCPVCNTYHDRDYNASVNILNEGLRLLNRIA